MTHHPIFYDTPMERVMKGDVRGEDCPLPGYREAMERALEYPTLEEALTSIAVWENDRAVRQAVENSKNRTYCNNDGSQWETCFQFLFKEVLRRWRK